MTDDPEKTELLAHIAKMEKINVALMDRVERQSDVGGSAFTMFETALSLNTMVRERTMALQDALAQLARANAQLADAHSIAEKANLSKTSFLAAASHDLLQPLNAARLFVSALAERRLAPPTRALVNQASTALDSVEDLLEALLEISRLDAGAIQPEIGRFRLEPLLGALRTEFQPLATAAGLDFRIAPSDIWLETDMRLLRRILQNFVSNAIRYTPRGSVRLEAAEHAGIVRIAVSDTGFGIPADKREQVFEEFRRLDSSRRIPGKGLGLAIVRRASDMLGHPLTLESEVGRGSTFAILVPRAEPVAQAPGIRTVAGTRAMASHRLLVIDNEPQILTGMETLLAGWGFRVSTAQSRAEAEQALTRHGSPDLIIADYHLDDGDTGDAAIETLRIMEGRTTPAILISADRSDTLKADLEARGMPLLGKPVKPAQLRALLRTMLA